MKRYLIIIVHIAAWACLMTLPFVFSPRRDVTQFSEPFIWMLVTLNAFLILFFYSNTEIFIPKLLAKRKWLFYSLVILVCLLVFIQLPKLFETAIRAELPDEIREKLARRRKSSGVRLFSGSTAVFFFVFTVSTCMKVMQQWLNAEKKKKEVENDKVVTELSFLKAQVNPHFLFNTLNNIYSLAVVKSDATAGAVLKLSSIMRYILQETKLDWVPLENEIKFIHDYIDLQRVRLTDKVAIEVNLQSPETNKMIAPLLLIPFVENAFKYGISTKESSSIKIELLANETQILFSISNSIVAAETSGTENTGIGLQNARRRLELLYPGKHNLEINTVNNTFIVHLTLHSQCIA